MNSPLQELKSLEQLKEFARRFVESWSNGAKVALQGELGAGKTAFVRACIDVLASDAKIQKPRVVSPTYVLHQSYPELIRTVEHFDLYRMDSVSHDDLIEIGFWEAVERATQSRGFVFVEWAERLHEVVVDFDAILRFSVDESRRHFVEALSV